jgi:LSD1 subclass zinc finger protein
MERANRFPCPRCRKPLKSVRGVRVGRKIKCPECQAAFLVRPEQAEQAERGGSVNAGRLLAALAGVLLYLLGGSVLAVYCFVNAHKQPVVEAETGGPNSEKDDWDSEASLPLPSPPPTGTVIVSTAEQRQIDDAIAKGVWFLKDSQKPSGAWGDDLPAGYAALAGLTLLECGVFPSNKVVQNAAKCVRQEVLKLNNTYDNYQRALAILFLDRLGEYNDKDLIQYLALCLIAGQHSTQGAWHYSSPVLDRKLVPQLLTLLKDKNRSLADWRKTALKGKTYQPDGWDNSNTQFVVLALWVAQRHEVAIEKPIALLEKHFRGTQQPNRPDPTGNNLNLEGSWLYDANNNSSAWPSMTCSGLLGLAIGHGVTTDAKEKKQKPLDDPAIQSALAMLAREIDRPDEKRGPDYYFLWSLERVGVLYDLPKIDGKDWYAWGRKVLLPRQQGDGSWAEGGFYGNNPTLNTCFVLLFLKQANLAADLTSKLDLLTEKK